MGRNDLWQLPLMERLLRDERLIGERETVFWARKGALCQLLASVLAGPTFVSRKLTLSQSSSEQQRARGSLVDIASQQLRDEGVGRSSIRCRKYNRIC